ncbi:TRAP transporter substrate-binding protein [Pseudochelatococcus sp. B33]
MKRRQFLHAAGLATAGLGAPLGASLGARAQTAGAAPPNPPQRNAAEKPLVWRLSSDFPGGLDTPRAGIEALAATLAEITEGAFTISVPPPAKAPKQHTPALDAVREGKAEIAYTSAAFYADRDPVLGIGGLPFGLNARQFNAWLLHRGGLDLLNDSYRHHGVRALSGGNTGALTGGWFRSEIGGVHDFAGRRVGAIGLAGALLARFGALPQALFPHDLAAALAEARIDIAQWTGPHEDEQLGLNKSAPFYYYPGWQGGVQYSFLVRLDAWDALPARHKAAFTAAAARAHDIVQARYDALNAAAIRRLVASGTRLRPTPQSVLTQLHGATEALAGEIATDNAAFRAIYDSIRIFSGEAYLWWQVTEYTYDNFMIRARAQG